MRNAEIKEWPANYRARYGYKALNDNELSFKVGDILLVIREPTRLVRGARMVHCELKGKQGLAPYLYLTKVSQDAEKKQVQQLEASLKQQNTVGALKQIEAFCSQLQSQFLAYRKLPAADLKYATDIESSLVEWLDYYQKNPHLANDTALQDLHNRFDQYLSYINQLLPAEQTPLPSSRFLFSLDDYHAAMQEAAVRVQKQFLGQLEIEYQSLLARYQRIGQADFEKQSQEQQKHFADYLQKQAAQLQTYTRVHQKAFQTQLAQVLSCYQENVLSSGSEEMLNRFETQLRQQLGGNFQAMVKNLLESKTYQEEVQRLQQALLERIQERQTQIALEMIHVQTQQRQLKNEHDPLYQQYQQRQQILAEQYALQNPEPVKVFYNTIEKALGSRLIGAMSLASGMVKREDTKGEQVADISINVTGKILDCFLLLGPVVKAGTTTFLELGAGAYSSYQDKKHDEKYQNTLDSFIRLEDAMNLAELIARRLAQSYKHHITQHYLSPEETQAAGENAANIVYNSIKAGELKSFEGKPLENKVDYLVKKVQSEAAKQRRGFFKKPHVFKEPVDLQLSKADKQHLQNVTYLVDAIGEKNELETKQAQLEIMKIKKENEELRANLSQIAYVQRQILLSPPASPRPQFSVLEETHWLEAINYIKTKVPGNMSLEIYRTEKKLTLTSTSDAKVMEQLGDTLQELFAQDIEDWEVENNQLMITAKASQKAKKLEQFLQYPDLKPTSDRRHNLI